MANNLTEVRLLSVPLESDYLHTIYFPDKASQESYFKGKTKHTMTGCTYQRQDNYIRFDKAYDDIINSNYVMYKNSAFSDKWYYAFITKIEYRDEKVSFVYISTDVIQTWMFDYLVKPSFVEREHVVDDRAGAHTIPEQLELGGYKVNTVRKGGKMGVSGVVLASTVNLMKLTYEDGGWFDPKPQCPPISGSLYGGVFSGVRYYYFSCSIDEGTGKTGIEDLQYVLDCLASMGQSDAVTSIFMVPENHIEIKTVGTISPSGGDLPITIREVKQTTSAYAFNWDNSLDSTGIGGGVYKPTAVDGYIPVNKKLLSYPFSYIQMSNNAGSGCVYKYELFENNLCTFQINSVVTPSMSIRLAPLHYNGCDINHEEGLNGGKFPICSWNTDVYTNWLTQNSINIASSFLGSAGQIGLGAIGTMTGFGSVIGGGMMLSGLTGVLNTVGEIEKHSMMPPQANGNMNNGDVMFADNELWFTAYQMSIRKEYAKVIDSYFTMFGYKVNQVHTPHKNHREAFWYTKTVDVNIDGAIPMEDLRKIKECYNKGITFWRHTVDIGNYAQDNGIIQGQG